MGSPFKVTAKRAEKFMVFNGTVGKPLDLELEIKMADIPDNLGTLNAEVTRPNGEQDAIRCSVTSLGLSGKLSISLTPEEAGEHTIDVRKGSKPLKCSPLRVVAKHQVAKANIFKGTIGQPLDINMEVLLADLPDGNGTLNAEVTRPNGREDAIRCFLVTRGLTARLNLNFTPEEKGDHLVNVYKGRQPLKGSPFTVEVQKEVSTVMKGEIGRTFTISTEINLVNLPDNAGTLCAEVVLPDGKRRPIRCSMITKGLLGQITALFVPKDIGKHEIHLKKGTKVLEAFQVMVSGTDVRENRKSDSEVADGLRISRSMSVENSTLKNVFKGNLNSETHVTYEIKTSDLPSNNGTLNAYVVKPGGAHEAIRCGLTKRGLIGQLDASFVPREVGTHLVHIRQGGVAVKGSPFNVNVQPQKENAKKKISKERGRLVNQLSKEEHADVISQAKQNVGLDVKFDIPGLHCKDFKTLKGELERPDKEVKEPLNLSLDRHNNIGAIFVPDVPGWHEITVKKPIDLALNVTMKPDSLNYLVGLLTRPNGNDESLDLKLDENGKMAIHFIPHESGEHLVSVKRNGDHIKGSPIKVMVSKS